MRLAPLLALALCVSLAAPARALTVTLDPGTGTSRLQAAFWVYLGFPVPIAATVEPAGVPQSGTLDTFDLFPGLLDASLIYDLSHSGFSFDYDTLRIDADETEARVEGTLYFSVDEAAGYVLSHSSVAVDPLGLLKYSYVTLRDLTTGSWIEEILGPCYCEFPAGRSFSATGTLLAGHEYRFSFYVNNYAEYDFPGLPEPQGTISTWNGTLSLLFVPEPPLAALAAALLGALRCARCLGPSPHPPRGR